VRSTAGRIVIAVVTVVVLVGLFALLRGRGEDEAGSDGATVATTTNPEPTTEPGTTSSEPPAPPPTSPPPGPRRIRITVRNGRVLGGVQRPRLNVGDRIVLVVRADVSDHVHVHGYDRFADVGPGRPAQLALRLTIPGRVEVELEDRHQLIAELEVRP
jgi:hypothetical protein